ncbi:MAG: 2-C-methyl-D-erythritol 4-phosphate cytidylyltransferase [Phycisphaerales bacterium]|jgi:2-C-methyl-D-erythritol 4-phosphate cytidylyltransferase
MPPPNSLAVIICAAGSGTRFGNRSGSKLDQDLHGRAVLHRAVEAFVDQSGVESIVVAGPADPDALEAFRGRHELALGPLGVSFCPGGKAERYETVKAGLEYLQASGSRVDAVLVHDAARPCTPRPLVRRVIEALGASSAVVPAIPVADTLKRADSTDDPKRARVVDETVDRRGLFACQTPQGFSLDLITRAYAQADLGSTDDAQLVERLGEPVTLVPGDGRNLKITRPEDLTLARAIWLTLSTDE